MGCRPDRKPVQQPMKQLFVPSSKPQTMLVNQFIMVIHTSLASPNDLETPPTTNQSGWFCLPNAPNNASLLKLKPKKKRPFRKETSQSSRKNGGETTNSGPRADQTSRSGYKSINALPFNA